MKKMVYLEEAHEAILESLYDDDIPLHNLVHTFMEEGSILPSIKEAICDLLTSKIDNSVSEFYARIYYIDADKEFSRVNSKNQLLKGKNVVQWAIDQLPEKFSDFALVVRPKNDLLDPSKQKVWVFMAS